MAKSTKRGGRDKDKDNNDDKKKKNQRKFFSTGSDNDPMFNVKSPGGKYTDTLVLLGDKIYGKNMPNAAGGEFCKYKVVKFQINEKKFKLHFMDQDIEPDVTNWIEFTSNKEDEIMKTI